MSRRFFFVMIILMAALIGCGEEDSTDTTPAPQASDNRPTLRIVSGSENRSLQPIIDDFEAEYNVNVELTSIGSVDISLLLQQPVENIEYDAVWPANSMLIRLGDTNGVTEHEESIWRSPVVLGIKKSIAEDLGWTAPGVIVTVEDIINAAETRDINLMMTSATQSNSGASAYFGFLYALSGQPAVLTSEILQDPQLEADIRRILGQIDRSSRSSGFLKDLFLSQYGRFDAMFNYETIIIEFNQELAELNRDGGNREPLYVVYPSDGLSIADSPLAYVDHGDAATEALFLQFQEYLLSDPVQQRMAEFGRRTGRVGLTLENPDPLVFNPNWGIDTNRTLITFTYPVPSVIREALNLYQTTFRKGSYTVYCLDFSGSMQGEGEPQLDEAMYTLLANEPSTRYLLQTSSRDTTIVIPFNGNLIDVDELASGTNYWRVEGNNANELEGLYRDVQNLDAEGNTDMYVCAMEALRLISEEVSIDDQFPAIIMMTDGESSEVNKAQFERDYAALTIDVPIYSIMFGDANPTQLQYLADISSAELYDGTENLVDAFRAARGNN